MGRFRLVQECLTDIQPAFREQDSIHQAAAPARTVRIEVEDQGKGIASERMAAIRSHGSGVGIRGIRERIRQFKGEMNIRLTYRDHHFRGDPNPEDTSKIRGPGRKTRASPSRS